MTGKDAGMDNKKEYILIAAVQHGEEIHLGFRHSDILSKFQCADTKCNLPLVQGFLTSKNRFVQRFEAYQIALEAGQVEKSELKGIHHRILISEDLY